MWWAELLNNILAVLGDDSGAPAAVGSYESIATVTGTGSSGIITFSSIPSTYKHLQIRLNGKCSSGAITDCKLKFNSDTGTNYAKHWIFALDSGGVYTSQESSNVPPSIGYIQGYDTYPTSAAVIDILDYQSTSKYKTVRYLTGGAEQQTSSQAGLVFGSILWMNSGSAINTIELALGASAWTTFSSFSLYGIKG